MKPCFYFQPGAGTSEISTVTSQTEETTGEPTEPEVLKEQTTGDDGPSAAMKWPLSHVRQNFGKLNVAPQFSQEDLVPVNMLDADETDSELEEEKEDCCPPGRAGTKAVLKSLEEKIAKYKRFLDKAKAKRFSAIRYGLASPLLWMVELVELHGCKGGQPLKG